MARTEVSRHSRFLYRACHQASTFTQIPNKPLHALPSGHGVLTSLLPPVRAPISAKTIPKTVDDAMDKAIPSTAHVQPGISIRNGPMEDHDHHMPDLNGVEWNGSTSKRKSRGSLVKPSYAEAGSSDGDEEPLVCLSSVQCAHSVFDCRVISSSLGACY